MSIILSITESDSEIIDGFPEYVTLSTNIPSTIFYTLDGTTPDESSDIFVEKINIPTTSLTITLKAIAISGDVSSSILEETYSTSQTNLDRTRIIGNEGINILKPSRSVVDGLSYNSDGELAQTTSIEFVDLDIKTSVSNKRGENIPFNSTIEFIRFAEKPASTSERIVSSPNNNNINFNPRALYITIDGTTQDNFDNQIVRIINRPHHSIQSSNSYYTKNSEEFQNNSASFVRYMVNPNTGVITFYYAGSREGRWITSTQKVEGKAINLTPKDSAPSSYVFRWIEDRAQTRIY